MQEVPTKVEEEDEDKGADEPTLEVKTEEKADPEHYHNLMSPGEDVFAEAEKPRQGLPGSARLYCVISCMSVICLILLMVVIILAAKRTTCPDSCSSSTEANLGDHVDLGVSLTSPSPAILTTVQAKSRIYSGEEVTANSREDVSTVNLEKLCTEHFRKTSHSGQKDTANNRKDPSMVKKLCSEHWRSICAGRKRCPYEWHTNGSYCFFLSTFTLTWDQSQSKCSSICGSLAVIPSQEVQNSLTEKGNLMYWIGLKKHQSAWQWVNNKTLEKSYWTRNPGDRDCALLKSTDPPEGNWIKESCRSSAYFICQLKN